LPEKLYLVKRDDVVDFVEWKFHTVSVFEHSLLTVNGKRLPAEIRGDWVHSKE